MTKSMSCFNENKFKKIILMLKDTPVCEINWNNGEVKILEEALLPYNLYLEEDHDFDTLLNNLVNLYSWCASRVLSLDRVHAKQLLNACGLSQASTDKERAEVALQYRCLTLQDFYWIKEKGDNAKWEDISLFRNSLDDALVDIALTGKNLTVTNLYLISQDLSTGGVFPKAWIRRGSEFYLLKGDVDDSVAKEVEASQILNLLGLGVLEYSYDNWNDCTVSKSKCFTSENNAFVTAEMMNIFLMNRNEQLRDFLKRYWQEFVTMNVADFLVGNTDRHAGNWGFTYNDEREITGFCPVFDFNHSFEGDIGIQCLPIRLFGDTVTQFDFCKECINEVIIDTTKEKELTKFKYGEFVLERLKMLKVI